LTRKTVRVVVEE